MELFAGDSVIKTYAVAIGRGGLAPKQRQGDQLTPVGAPDECAPSRAAMRPQTVQTSTTMSTGILHHFWRKPDLGRQHRGPTTLLLTPLAGRGLKKERYPSLTSSPR